MVLDAGTSNFKLQTPEVLSPRITHLGHPMAKVLIHKSKSINTFMFMLLSSSIVLNFFTIVVVTLFYPPKISGKDFDTVTFEKWPRF
jgi:hypothetical protein